jgi:hypothetical protein
MNKRTNLRGPDAHPPSITFSCNANNVDGMASSVFYSFYNSYPYFLSLKANHLRHQAADHHSAFPDIPFSCEANDNRPRASLEGCTNKRRKRVNEMLLLQHPLNQIGNPCKPCLGVCENPCISGGKSGLILQKSTRLEAFVQIITMFSKSAYCTKPTP